MDLSTSYLGLKLAHPVIAGSGPLAADLDAVKRLAEAGPAAVVMPSLFEEQLSREQWSLLEDMERGSESFAEARSYLPTPADFRVGPDEYLEQIHRIKQGVGVPVFGSLNGVTAGGWMEYARKIQDAGADALELNIYYLPTAAKESSSQVEARTIGALKAVRSAVTIPVAVKLSPFFSSLPNLAHKLAVAGAKGLVLFNRFYQPDFDLEKLEVVPALRLSDPTELLLRLRWTAILSGRVKTDLAISGGVHTASDAVKALLAGANAVQVVSALLTRGPGAIHEIRDGISKWLEGRKYQSLRQCQGSLNLSKSPNPAAFERANYMKVLGSR